MIHPTAIVHPDTDIDKTVYIGPNVVIEDNVIIKKGTKILANAYIGKYTSIGEDCQIHIGAVLGNTPQDVAFKNARSFLKIGRRNIFREYTTVHRGTAEDSVTVIGDDNYFMVNAHIGHNCSIGNRVVIVNSSVLGGYVVVEDDVFISAYSAIHQFVRIGSFSIISASVVVTRDVPPYMMLGFRNTVTGLNLVGMRRAGLNSKHITAIRKAFKILYYSNMVTKNAINEIEKNSELSSMKEIQYLTNFIRNSKRGICGINKKL